MCKNVTIALKIWDLIKNTSGTLLSNFVNICTFFVQDHFKQTNYCRFHFDIDFIHYFLFVERIEFNFGYNISYHIAHKFRGF